MWGDEPQLEAFRERLKVLLEAHEQDLNPQVITADKTRKRKKIKVKPYKKT